MISMCEEIRVAQKQLFGLNKKIESCLLSGSYFFDKILNVKFFQVYLFFVQEISIIELIRKTKNNKKQQQNEREFKTISADTHRKT